MLIAKLNHNYVIRFDALQQLHLQSPAQSTHEKSYVVIMCDESMRCLERDSDLNQIKA